MSRVVIPVDFQQRGNLPDDTDIRSLSSAAPSFPVMAPVCFQPIAAAVRTPASCVNYSPWLRPDQTEQPFEACELCQCWNGRPF